jgi:hypothetical protein
MSSLDGTLFLSLDEVLEIHEQQIERYGGLQVFVMPGLNQLSPRRSQPSVASSYTPRFRPWQRRIFSIFARTMRSSTVTNESARTRLSHSS